MVMKEQFTSVTVWLIGVFLTVLGQQRSSGTEDGDISDCDTHNTRISSLLFFGILMGFHHYKKNACKNNIMIIVWRPTIGENLRSLLFQTLKT